jgi:1-acyl-sn-glycerol-3-phosphate acyltransferase
LPNAIRQAQPPLAFLPPNYSPWVFRAIRAVLPAWMRYRLSITATEVEHIDRLVELYQRFQQGKVRVLLAFRHPTIDDPFTMAYLMWHLLPQAARGLNVKLLGPTHSHFIYDRGISLWAGPVVNWLFPRLGGTPILRGKADRLGLKTARDLLTNGQFLLAAAPEGATNDHSELMNPLEPGVAQLGFWAAEDIHKAERSEETFILPIGIHYSFVIAPWPQMETMLTQIEHSCGLMEPGPPAGVLSDRQADALYGRIFVVAEHLLDITEQFYARFYNHTFMPLQECPADGQARSHRLTKRFQIHLDAALQVAEARLGTKPQGSFVDRCRRLEQAGWDRIFREDIGSLSTVERGLADWAAEEASLTLWHMRLAERLTVVTGDYILQKPSADRFAEVLTILWRVTTWLESKETKPVPHLGKRKVRLTIGKPLSVTQRLPHYQENRRSARIAVQQLTEDLKDSMQNMMEG